jgi:ribosomal protein L12E/L44/L45/RPP1/RPP2
VLLSGPATSPENSYSHRTALSAQDRAEAVAAIAKAADKVRESEKAREREREREKERDRHQSDLGGLFLSSSVEPFSS